MIGNAHFDGLINETPPPQVSMPKVDWAAYAEGLEVLMPQPDAALATSWCVFSDINIEANVASPGLAAICPWGAYVSTGKRSLIGKSLKASMIDFDTCREFRTVDWQDDRGWGKSCIEFAGSGRVLLGRLEWMWLGKRFRDNRPAIMAAAAERDRILEVISDARQWQR